MKKLLLLLGLVAVFAFLMLGRHWANDPEVQRYRQIADWHARCDQYRDVTRRDTPMVVAAAEKCQEEAARLVGDGERLR